MSMNDTDKWASMIINELFDEAIPYENMSDCISRDDKEVDEKVNVLEISDNKQDSFWCASANYKNNLSDFLDSYDEGFGLTSTASNRISEEFNTTDNVVANSKFNKNQSFVNAQNITQDCNSKSNAQIQEAIDLIDLAIISDDKSIDGDTKSSLSRSGVETKNKNEEVMLINLHDSFIQDIEAVSAASQDSHMPFLPENGKKNSNGLSELWYEKCDSLDSLSIEESHYMFEKNKKNPSLAVRNESKTNSFEKLYVNKCNSDIFQPFGENNCCWNSMQGKSELQTEETSIVSPNTEPVNRSSEEYLNTINEGLKQPGLCKFEKDNFHHKWFEENYIGEEMGFKWESNDGLVINESLTVNTSNSVHEGTFQSISVGKNAEDNINNLLLSDESRKIWDLNDKTALGIRAVDEEDKEIDVCSKRKIKMPIDENFEYTDENFLESKQWLNKSNQKQISGKNSYYGSRVNHNKIYRKSSEKTNPKRSIFTNCEMQSASEIPEIRNETDEENQNIRNERVDFVVDKYRYICSIVEVFFVRPFANILDDSYEFLSFMFLLFVCLICFIYGRVQFLLSYYRLRKTLKSTNNFSNKKDASVMTCSEKPISEAVFGDEGLSYIVENSSLKLSFKKSDVIPQLKDTASWVQVEPAKIRAVCMGTETENIRHLYENGKTFLSLIRRREKHKATLVENDHCLVDLKLIIMSEKERNKFLFNENDFGMKITASPKRLQCDADNYDKHEVLIPFDVEQISEYYEGNYYTEPPIMRSSSNPLIEILPSDSYEEEKTVLNSTQVEEFEGQAVPKCDRSSYFKLLSTPTVVHLKDIAEMQLSPIPLKKKHLNSSLSVNCSPFSSRSDITSDSMPLLDMSEGFYHDEKIEWAEAIKMSNETRKDFHDNLDSFSLNTSTDADSRIVCTNDKNSYGSAIFQVSDAGDVFFQDKSILESSFVGGDANDISGVTISSTESDLLMTDESSTADVKGNPKKKNSGLKRRMSVILNNMRSIMHDKTPQKQEKGKRKR